MNKDYNHSSFKQLLDKLQQESWQLELLISGFAIFGLFSAIGYIDLQLDIAHHKSRLVETLLWFAAEVCCWILISNLLIHVILRGLWIGALGLRYVSGDIDYNELKYSAKFTNYLKKKIGSFDKYISTLEDYCSILFAISFLFVFYFLASLLFIVLILIIIFVFLNNDYTGTLENVLNITGVCLILFTLLGMLLTFIDFITQGFLKRKKWTSKLYFPVYRIFSIVTLSFLYRPLVYNFLDNKFGKRLSFILVPVYIGILYLSSFKYNNSNYIDIKKNSSSYHANLGNYEDLIIKDNDFIKQATIQSKVITDNYLKVFIVFDENMEDRLYSYNPGLKPDTDERGLRSEIYFSNRTNISRKKRDSLQGALYKTFNEIYSLKIDTTSYNSHFISTTDNHKNLGFETYINIKKLEEGEHLLKIMRKYIRKNKKDTLNRRWITIPFWKFDN